MGSKASLGKSIEEIALEEASLEADGKQLKEELVEMENRRKEMENRCKETRLMLRQTDEQLDIKHVELARLLEKEKKRREPSK